jgi:hypothetical protein
MAEQTVYCTKDDVQRWVKRVQFSEQSKVTPSDVDFYIQVVSAIIDGELGRIGVTLPVPYSAKKAQSVLKSLTSFEAASLAEQAANFGANKNESAHGKWLHDKYLELLEQIKTNPHMLGDVVVGTCSYMQNSRDGVFEGGTKEGEEIFTKQRIDDFVSDHKVLSPSEPGSMPDTITGLVPRTRV